MITRFLLFIICICVSGCDVAYLGTVGDTKFYAVCHGRIDGPNISALVSEKEGKAHVENCFAGNGILDSIGAAGISAGVPIATAYIDRPNVNVTNNTPATGK